MRVSCRVKIHQISGHSIPTCSQVVSLVPEGNFNNASVDCRPPYTLRTLSQNLSAVVFHNIKGKEGKAQKGQKLFTCEKPGCMDSFSTTEELNDHLLIGQCRLQLEQKRSVDQAKYLYASKLKAAGLEGNVTVTLSSSTKPGMSSLLRGCSMKQEKKSSRFLTPTSWLPDLARSQKRRKESTVSSTRKLA